MKAGANTIVEDVGAQSKQSQIVATPSPETEPDTTRVLEPMPLVHFIALEYGNKQDQAAGFAFHAKGMGARTIHEWREAFRQFQMKPIR